MTVSELVPEKGSVGDEKKWKWSHGMKEVKEFEIAVAETGKDVEMVIDSIVLVGLDYEKTFGVKKYVAPDDVGVKTLYNNSKNFSCNSRIVGKNLSVSYNLK